MISKHFTVSDFTILGAFADFGQTTVDQCAVISRSAHNPLESASVTTTTITTTVTKLLDKLPTASIQREDMSTINSTEGTSSIITSTEKNAPLGTIILSTSQGGRNKQCSRIMIQLANKNVFRIYFH